MGFTFYISIWGKSRIKGGLKSFHISALEQESYLQHYAYSLDNGLTWSEFYPLTKGVNSMTVMVNTKRSKSDRIIFKVLNQYDNPEISNTIFLH